jgi:hypothetical protein
MKYRPQNRPKPVKLTDGRTADPLVSAVAMREACPIAVSSRAGLAKLANLGSG